MSTRLNILIVICGLLFSSCSTNNFHGSYSLKTKTQSNRLSLHADGTFVQKVNGDWCGGTNYLFGTYKKQGRNIFLHTDFNEAYLINKRDYIFSIKDSSVNGSRLYIVYRGKDVYDTIKVRLINGTVYYTNGEYIELPEGYEGDSISIYAPHSTLLPQKIKLDQSKGDNLFYFMFFDKSYIIGCEYYFFRPVLRIKGAKMFSATDKKKPILFKEDKE